MRVLLLTSTWLLSMEILTEQLTALFPCRCTGPWDCARTPDRSNARPPVRPFVGPLDRSTARPLDGPWSAAVAELAESVPDGAV